jgi:hypothetical protein
MCSAGTWSLFSAGWKSGVLAALATVIGRAIRTLLGTRNKQTRAASGFFYQLVCRRRRRTPRCGARKEALELVRAPLQPDNTLIQCTY